MYNHGSGLNNRHLIFLSNCCAKGGTYGAVFICKIGWWGVNPGNT